ncbi:uncharacterized protein LOC110214509 [Phascolarctos cinereus]
MRALTPPVRGGGRSWSWAGPNLNSSLLGRCSSASAAPRPLPAAPGAAHAKAGGGEAPRRGGAWGLRGGTWAALFQRSDSAGSARPWLAVPAGWSRYPVSGPRAPGTRPMAVAFKDVAIYLTQEGGWGQLDSGLYGDVMQENYRNLLSLDEAREAQRSCVLPMAKQLLRIRVSDVLRAHTFPSQHCGFQHRPPLCVFET